MPKPTDKNNNKKNTIPNKANDVNIANIPSAIDPDITEISKIFERYKGVLNQYNKNPLEEKPQSRQVYKTFKESFEELKKPHTFYEKLTKRLGIFKVAMPKKYEQKYNEAFDTQNIFSISPRQIVFVAFLLFVLSIVLSFGIFVFTDIIYAALLFTFCMMLIGFYLYYPFLREKRTIQKFNNLAPIALLYIIVYLKNNPVLENALFFASTRLEGPLAYNLRKLLWDLSYSKYPSLDDALDDYIKKWRRWSPVFVDSLEKVRMASYEENDSNRIKRYDTIIDEMLQEIQESTKLFVKGLKTPTSILHMLGIMLPMMVSIMFPMIVLFLPDIIKPGYLALVYDFILPFLILMVLYIFICRRPGFGEVIFESSNKSKISKFQMIKSVVIFFIIASPAIVFFAAFYSPLGFHVVQDGGLNLKVSSNGYSFLPSDYVNLTLKSPDSNIVSITNVHLSKQNNGTIAFGENTTTKPIKIVENINGGYDISYKLPLQQQIKSLVEPHSFSADVTLADGTTGKITISYLIKQISILWVFVVITLFIAIVWFVRNFLGKIIGAYKKKSENAAVVERELGVSFYQLSSLLLRGFPLVTAMQRIVNTTRVSEVRIFFNRILKNMLVLKMNLEDALYDPKVGALTYAPSKLIYDLLVVVTKTAVKGSKSLARTLASLSVYLHNMEKINMQIKQEMADTVSSAKINVYMLLPFISATIISFVFLMSVIFNLIAALPGLSMTSLNDEGYSTSSLTSIGLLGFKIYGTLPPDLFAVIVGIYFVIIVIILSYFVSYIVYGDNILKFAEILKDNLLVSTIVFIAILFGMSMIFSLIADMLVGVFIISS